MPILRVEVISDSEHDVELYQRAMEKLLGSIYVALHQHFVFVEGTLLNIEFPTGPTSSAAEEITQATITALQRTVPPAMPGIYFSIGEVDRYRGRKPWRCAVSWGKKLQLDVLTRWNGKKENFAAAQNALLEQIASLHDQSERNASA